MRSKFAQTHEQLKDLVRRHKALKRNAQGRKEHRHQTAEKVSQVRHPYDKFRVLDTRQMKAVRWARV